MTTGKLRLMPYPVPAPVRALGEPQHVFAPSKQPSEIGRVAGLVLMVLAFLLLMLVVVLLHFAVHPSPAAPPPLACRILATIFVLLAGASAYGAWFYVSGAGDHKRAYAIYPQCLVELSPKSHRIIPWEKIKAGAELLKTFAFPTGSGKAIMFDSTLPKHAELARLIRARAGTLPPKAEPIEGMQSMMLSQAPTLFEPMRLLVDALVSAAAPHHAMLHLVADVRKSNGKSSVLFTYGSPVLTDEYSTLVPDSVAHAAYALIDAMTRHDASFPGFEIALRKKSADAWNMQFHRLDEPAPPECSNMPRCPLRVVGHGLSLAPLLAKTYQWTQRENPLTITANVRGGKHVQILLSDGNHKLVLGQGVTKADEIIEVAEGPDSTGWTIETPDFSIAWPSGFDLRSPLATKTRFDLVAAPNTLIFVQGPGPNVQGQLQTMAVEGQREVGRGTTAAGHEWIELAYAFDGAKWRQRHYALASFVVSAQSAEPGAAHVFQAADQVTDSLAVPIV